MALNKVTYVDNETVIGADNLNEIQDAIVALEKEISELKALVEALPQMSLDSDTATLTITGV